MDRYVSSICVSVHKHLSTVYKIVYNILYHILIISNNLLSDGVYLTKLYKYFHVLQCLFSKKLFVLPF
jgi:hypothetical protein